MPLESVYHWNMEEDVLSGLVFILLGFLNVDHYKLFIVSNRDISDSEFSTECVSNQSTIVMNRNHH